MLPWLTLDRADVPGGGELTRVRRGEEFEEEQLRRFLARPWARLRQVKDRHTLALVEREGADAAFRLAELLRAHARAMGAEQSRAERDADLVAVVRLKELLERASRRSERAR